MPDARFMCCLIQWPGVRPPGSEGTPSVAGNEDLNREGRMVLLKALPAVEDAVWIFADSAAAISPVDSAVFASEESLVSA